MKCPLFAIGWLGREDSRLSETYPCIQNECSWYDLASSNCAVLELLRQFTALGMVLGKIHDVLNSRLK